MGLRSWPAGAGNTAPVRAADPTSVPDITGAPHLRTKHRSSTQVQSQSPTSQPSVPDRTESRRIEGVVPAGGGGAAGWAGGGAKGAWAGG
eukprot:2638187-Rhodomonas_salina.1